VDARINREENTTKRVRYQTDKLTHLLALYCLDSPTAIGPLPPASNQRPAQSSTQTDMYFHLISHHLLAVYWNERAALNNGIRLDKEENERDKNIH